MLKTYTLSGKIQGER